MKNYFIYAVFLQLAFFQAHAVKVESLQQNRLVYNSSGSTASSAFLGTETQPFTINLPQIPADLTSTNRGVHKTGTVYQLPSRVTGSQLSWEPVNGGYVARIQVFSDQAKRLRLHLIFSQEMPSIQFRVKGSMDPFPLGPINSILDNERAIWLPITNGNSTDLEIFAKDIQPTETLDFSIDAVNIIFEKLSSISSPNIIPKSLGLAEEIEYDLACWSGIDEDTYRALEYAASATALIHFITDRGSYICNGTLITDRAGTNTPWLTTANHCISDQRIANTAAFEWFYQANSCGSSETDSRYAQTFGGAQLLWTDVYLDASLLRLNNPPPQGVFFSGWSTDIQIGDLVWGVHHPRGDHTMVSEGNVADTLITATDQTGESHLLNVVYYFFGGTEPGSSGSGLFSISNGSLYWMGTLSGGLEDNYQVSFYSSFSSYYTNIKPWLENTYASKNIECLLNWAENNYPGLFSPAGAITQFQAPYTYRYYGNTNFHLGTSSINSHVYYLGPDGILVDVGYLSEWLITASCQ